MSKFKVTTKTIFFEEHIVNADNHAEAKTKAFESPYSVTAVISAPLLYKVFNAWI